MDRAEQLTKALEHLRAIHAQQLNYARLLAEVRGLLVPRPLAMPAEVAELLADVERGWRLNARNVELVTAEVQTLFAVQGGWQ